MVQGDGTVKRRGQPADLGSTDAKARKLRENLARRKARQRALKEASMSDGKD